jgi:hypothetical protein
MSKYIGFNLKDLKAFKEDVLLAKQLAQRCMNALVYRPGGPTQKIQKLLLDTFMISLYDWESEKNWDKVGDIRMRFGSFGGRMDIVTCSYTRKYPVKPGEMPPMAYIDPQKTNFIFITPLYYKKTVQKYRSATLIHEFIHLIQRQSGHPGSIQIIFGGQTYLGIPFDKAFDNPYCYQYFAEWL